MEVFSETLEVEITEEVAEGEWRKLVEQVGLKMSQSMYHLDMI